MDGEKRAKSRLGRLYLLAPLYHYQCHPCNTGEMG
jgi:hypothetical protein